MAELDNRKLSQLTEGEEPSFIYGIDENSNSRKFPATTISQKQAKIKKIEATSYLVKKADAGKVLWFTSDDPINLTFPQDTTEDVGPMQGLIIQAGFGIITSILEGGDEAMPGLAETNGKGSGFTFFRREPGVWWFSSPIDTDVLHDGDNISRLLNDAGYITETESPVLDVDGKTGNVDLSDDYEAKVKNKLDALVDPEATNDRTEGYAILSRWINQKTGAGFICINDGIGVAEWVNMTSIGLTPNIYIKDWTLTTPPGSPANGDKYIPASPATGLWSGLEGKITEWYASDSTWVPTEPEDGWTATVTQKGGTLIQHYEGAWRIAQGVSAQYTKHIITADEDQIIDLIPYSPVIVVIDTLVPILTGDIEVSLTDKELPPFIIYFNATAQSHLVKGFGDVGPGVNVLPGQALFIINYGTMAGVPMFLAGISKQLFLGGFNQLDVFDKSAMRSSLNVYGKPEADSKRAEINGVKQYSGTSETVVAADKGKLIETNNVAANDLIIPADILPVNSILRGMQAGDGKTTLVQGAGVTINSLDGNTTKGKYGRWKAIQRSLNVWVLDGHLEP